MPHSKLSHRPFLGPPKWSYSPEQKNHFFLAFPRDLNKSTGHKPHGLISVHVKLDLLARSSVVQHDRHIYLLFQTGSFLISFPWQFSHQSLSNDFLESKNQKDLGHKIP